MSLRSRRYTARHMSGAIQAGVPLCSQTRTSHNAYAGKARKKQVTVERTQTSAICARSYVPASVAGCYDCWVLFVHAFICCSPFQLLRR